MATFIQFAILGLGAGTAYALLAQGLLVVYRGSGTVNFAQGAMAMVAAYLFWQVDAKSGAGLVPALLVSILATTLIGVAVYQLLMRPLPPLARLSRVIVTLGLLLAFEGACQLIWGTVPITVNSFLPTNVIHAGSVTVSVDRLILLAIAILLTAGLWVASRSTSLGLAIRANAENPLAVSTLGWSPNTLGTLSWGAGAALAALAGIFIAPLSSIETSSMPLLIIPALAAVLVGRLSSFWLTLSGAMAIGIAQSLISKYVTGIPGAVEATPFVLILILLVVRKQGLPTRSQGAQRLPSLGTGKIRPALVIPAIAIAAFLLYSVFPEELTIALGISLSWSIVLLSVLVLLGYTGQLSLAQFALGGIAALVAGRLVATGDLSFFPALLVAIVATTVVGMVFALPAIRARGINLAVVTLGLGVAVSALVFSNGNLTGGFDGTVVGTQSLFGLDLSTVLHPRRWALFELALFVICALLVANVRRGSAGRRLIAVRTNERAASALGVNVIGVKLYAFGLAAAVAGVGGVLLAFQNTTILYSQFDPFQSILAVGYSFVGGVGFILGAPTGSTLAAGGFGGWLLNQLFPGASAAWLVVVSGISLIVLAIVNPDGIVARQTEQLRALWRRIKRDEGEVKVSAELPAEERGHRVEPLVLEIRDVVVRFGGVTAVAGARLRVEPGEVVGLIGPNGAGKTTLVDTISGFVRPSEGEVLLGGERIDRWPVHRRARSGISRSFQSLELFESSTVRENLAVASDSSSRGVYASDPVAPRGSRLSPAGVAAVRELDLVADLDRRVSDLPYGRRRLVAIARAICTSPSILLLDEPAAGLSSGETQELAQVIERLAERWGFGVLVIEHDMAFVMALSDRVVVLDFGRQIAYGSPEEIRNDPAVIAAYLGDEREEPGSAKVSPSVTTGAAPRPATSAEGA